MRTVSRVFSYVKRYPAMVVMQLMAAIGGALLVWVPPWSVKRIVDGVSHGMNAAALLPLAAIAAAAYFGRDLLNGLRIFLNNTLEQRVIRDIRSDLYEKLQRLPLPWFDQKPTGDLMTTVAEDVPSMERILIDGVEMGLVAVLQIFVVGAFLFSLNTNAGLLTLAPLPFWR